MIKRIVVLIIIVFFVILSNIKIGFSEIEIENKYLQKMIDAHGEITEKRKRRNHPFTKCIEDCYEESEKWHNLNDGIDSITACIKNDDCIMCVNSCINKYESEIDQETMDTYIEHSKNLCFINSLI